MINDGITGIESVESIKSEYFIPKSKKIGDESKKHLAKIQFNNYRNHLSLPNDVSFGKVTLLYALNV